MVTSRLALTSAGVDGVEIAGERGRGEGDDNEGDLGWKTRGDDDADLEGERG